MGTMGVGRKIKKMAVGIFVACLMMTPVTKISGVRVFAEEDDENAAKIVQIASHGDLSLALDEDGNVYQWGSVYGVNFGATMGNKIYYTPTKVEGLPKIKEISSGMASFALAETGEVYAWGKSGYTGLGVATSAADLLVEITEPQKLPLTNIQRIWSGDCYNYAMDGAGKVYVWGYDRGRYLDLLTGNNGEHIYTPIEYPVSGVKEIAVGYTAAYGLTENGDVYVWGTNMDDFGLGLNSQALSGSLIPMKIEGLGHIVSVAAGMSEVMAVDEDGNVYAWAANNSDNKMLLEDDKGDFSVLSPKKVGELEDIKAVSVYSTYVAMNGDGGAYIWGYAGDISKDVEGGYFAEMTDAGVANVKQVVAAGATVIFLTENGSIYQTGTMFREGVSSQDDIDDNAVFAAENMVMSEEPVLIFGEGETMEVMATTNTADEGGNVVIWVILAIVGFAMMAGAGVMGFLYVKQNKMTGTVEKKKEV